MMDGWTGQDLEGSYRRPIRYYPGICMEGLRIYKKTPISIAFVSVEIKTGELPLDQPVWRKIISAEPPSGEKWKLRTTRIGEYRKAF
jgi:hypothetical protein